MSASSGLPESYDVWELKGREKFLYYICSGSALFFLGLLFYRSAWTVLFAAGSVLMRKKYESIRAGARKEQLLEGFRDTLYTISGSVAAGRQMPAALEDAARQAGASYGNDSCIYIELRHICQIYDSAHGDIGELLTDFGRRSGLDEIRQFASSYDICRNNGGDVEGVCLKSASLLLDKIAFRSEVLAMTAQKKLDISLLTAMPVLMLLILNLSSFSYIAPLYSGLLGRSLMTLCLGGIAASVFLSIRITEIGI